MIICDVTHGRNVTGTATVELKSLEEDPVLLHLDLSPEAFAAFKAGDWAEIGRLAGNDGLADKEASAAPAKATSAKRTRKGSAVGSVPAVSGAPAATEAPADTAPPAEPTADVPQPQPETGTAPAQEAPAVLDLAVAAIPEMELAEQDDDSFDNEPF